MSYVGKWVFHSIGMVNDSDEVVFLSAEEYLKAPMPYIDESDEEAVADELKERRKMIGGYDGMMTDDPKAWEERDGELWLEVGEGMSEDGWVKLSDDDGNLLFMTTRYVRAE